MSTLRALIVVLLLCAPLSAQPDTWFTPTAPHLNSTWVSAEQWGSSPGKLSSKLLQVPNRIVLHHAGVVWKDGTDPYAKVRALQSWGKREKHWPDLPYHYLIVPDGRIFEGRSPTYRPESNTRYDLDGVLNVQLFGDFEVQEVTPQQKEALQDLLLYLCRTRNIDDRHISTHRLEAPEQTTCPGRDLSDYYSETLLPALRVELQDYGKY